MTPAMLSLAFGYVALALLLLAALLASDIRAGRKLLLTLASGALYVWHYLALQDYPGWPADDALPARFEVLASRVVEPDRQAGSDGAIYLWLRDLDDDGGVPRAYVIDYRKTLHREIDDAQRGREQGERLVGAPLHGAGGRRQGIDIDVMRRDGKGDKPAE